ncbi:hypothetical protein QYE76_058275 [Lolium multiflorum]|uniref:Uncharacterized protein n=1 Tax=Lolium multiflorum TaxID=4521 RepID=A0AAD8T6L4_LOLMU|nr:hypothetical protein QYE76_058275 [Lolium multiflorum]
MPRHASARGERALDAPEHGVVPTLASTPSAHSLHRASPPVPLRARHTRASPEDLSPSPPSKPCRGYRGVIIKRPSRPIVPWTRPLHPEPRHAVANRVLSFPCPFARRSSHAVDEPLQHPRHHHPSINRDLPRPSPSHHHDRLTSLLRLDQTIHQIIAGAAAIWSLKPPEPADHRRRFTPPRASPLLPGASSPSTTPPRTLQNLAGAPNHTVFQSRGGGEVADDNGNHGDPCVSGGELLRRRLTLVPGAAVWGQVEEMQAVQSEIAVLKKQGEKLQKQCVETTTTLKSMNETLKQLGSWVLQVDGSLKSIQAAVDSVGARVTALEADRVGAEDLRTPVVEMGDLENGKSSNTLRVAVPTGNIASRRGFPNTPVNFNLGVQSGHASEFEDSGSDNEDNGNIASSSDESFMHISQYALAGATSKKSIRLQGPVNGKQVLLLIDSGSCGSFDNNTAVEQLGLATTQVHPVTVQVANGAKSHITTAVTGLVWECQGSKYKGDFRVFQIPCYDIILGMDWLNACGKMWIDWPKKKLRFRHEGKRITLKGWSDKVTSCEQISMAELQRMVDDRAVAQVVRLCPVSDSVEADAMPYEIEVLLKEHEECFAIPKGLPPSRAFDHKIPRMEGAQPVNVKPY